MFITLLEMFKVKFQNRMIL